MAIEQPVTQTTFPFPFAVSAGGRVTATGGDEAVRARIMQVLFTTPGERVNRPDFGCGLFSLVFDPNNPVLAAALEFTIGQALVRWLGADLVVNAVAVQSEDEMVQVQVVYTRRQDLVRQAVNIRFR